MCRRLLCTERPQHWVGDLQREAMLQRAVRFVVAVDAAKPFAGMGLRKLDPTRSRLAEGVRQVQHGVGWVSLPGDGKHGRGRPDQSSVGEGVESLAVHEMVVGLAANRKKVRKKCAAFDEKMLRKSKNVAVSLSSGARPSSR